MLSEIVITFLSTFAAALIGAIPFGLTNLTVLHISVTKNKKQTYPVAHGASVIELVYGIIGLITGKTILKLIENDQLINSFIIVVLIVVGAVFFLKKNKVVTRDQKALGGFMYGVLLNLLSLQVLLYWIIAAGILVSRQWVQFDITAIVAFLIAVWTGKLFVLYLYALLGQQIMMRYQNVASNINKIIGIILIILATINAARFWF